MGNHFLTTYTFNAYEISTKFQLDMGISLRSVFEPYLAARALVSEKDMACLSQLFSSKKEIY